MNKITFFFCLKHSEIKIRTLFLFFISFVTFFNGFAQSVTIGTGTSSNSSTGYPGIFTNYYYGNKIQILYEASEIIAAGGVANSYINSIAFDVAALNSVPDLPINAKIYTTNNANPLVTTSFFNGANASLSLTTYTVVAGWNTLTFTNPILWNGCDNIVVEICTQLDDYTDDGNASTRYTTMSGSKTYVRYFYDDDYDVCSQTSGYDTSTRRPNIKFGYTTNTVNCGYVCNTVGVPTQTSIDVTWTGTGTSYEIQYGVEGFVLGTGTTLTTNSLSQTISSLSINTSYDIYIKQICTTGPSAGFYGPIKVKTLCGVVDDLFEGFEDMSLTYEDEAPDCWTLINTVPPGPWWVSATAYASDYESKSGSQSMYVMRDVGTGDFMLISPETDNLGSGAKQLRFSVYLDYSDGDPEIEIYRLNNNTATATKTLISSVALSTTSASWEEFVIQLPATTDDYFALSFPEVSGSGYAEFFIDDVYYEDIPAPTLTTTQNNNLCFGVANGTASVVVKDGVAPLTYSWSPSGGTTAFATGLAAGTYTVTVTDAIARTATTTVTITEPDDILSNAAVVNVSCNAANNGSITLATTGGTLPYTYLWSNAATTSSLTGLTPGLYSVTITDVNGCTKTEDFTITEPTILTSSGTQVDVSFYGGSDGSATVTATGGTAPYTYSWSPSGGTSATASNLIAGTYTVTVTDANGCTATQSFTIIQPIPLMVQSASQTNVSCNGGTDGTAAVVVIGGNAPYTYLWSPGGATTNTVSGLTAGDYTVTITDSTNNTLTESFTITEPLALNAIISSKTDITCNFASNGTATVSATGGTAPYTYFWTNGMTTANASNLNVGTYTVTVTDANGCKATTTATITQPSALVATKVTEVNISCYGQNDGSASVSVSGGVAPYTYSWSNGQSGTSISNLQKGNYTVTITDANGCVTTQTFTIVEPDLVHPPVAVNQNFCIGQNATLSNIVITGSNIKWYSTATGGVVLPATTALTTGTTYYASQTVNGCESSSRTAVQITLNQGTPLTTTQLNVCGNTRIQNVTIDGFNHTQLKWYDSQTSTTELSVGVLLTTGTYYVSSVTGACVSSRQAIQITVAAVVPSPTVTSQTVCGNTTLNDLIVGKDPSATLNWYSSTQSMIPLAHTTVVSSGTYYVQQVIGTCESVRVPVAVQVVTVNAPTMTSITTCTGVVIGDLHPTNGTSYVWYTSNTSTTALADTFVVTSGTYYIALKNGNCTSTRTSVVVNVNSRPASPTGSSQQFFGAGTSISSLVMNEPNVSWFASNNDAVKQINQLPSNHQLQDKTTYYGILTGASNCGSAVPTAVTVTITTSTQELDLAQLNYYPNPVDSELTISYIEEINRVEVFTITGQRVLDKAFKANEVRLDVSVLSAGTYMVKVQTANASQFIKVVKK